MDYAEPLLEVVIDEDFGESHAVMMKQCTEPMMSVVDCTMLILEKCIIAAEDGEVDAGEVRELQDQVDDMPRLVAALQNKAS